MWSLFNSWVSCIFLLPGGNVSTRRKWLLDSSVEFHVNRIRYCALRGFVVCLFDDKSFFCRFGCPCTPSCPPALAWECCNCRFWLHDQPFVCFCFALLWCQVLSVCTVRLSWEDWISITVALFICCLWPTTWACSHYYVFLLMNSSDCLVWPVFTIPSVIQNGFDI